jgi:hypothetical protein
MNILVISADLMLVQLIYVKKEGVQLIMINGKTYVLVVNKSI